VNQLPAGWECWARAEAAELALESARNPGWTVPRHLESAVQPVHRNSQTAPTTSAALAA
jgi:hypothetical protein